MAMLKEMVDNALWMKLSTLSGIRFEKWLVAKYFREVSTGTGGLQCSIGVNLIFELLR
jgi:hypothetical protein